MSVRSRRVSAWLIGAACLVAVVALVLTAIFNLEVGDRTASVIVGVTALVGLALSVITLLKTPSDVHDGQPGARRSTVRSQGRRAIAAGGDIRGNAIGKAAKVIARPDLPATSSSDDSQSMSGRDISATGTGALSAGGNIVDNAIGENSERNAIGEDSEG